MDSEPLRLQLLGPVVVTGSAGAPITVPGRHSLALLSALGLARTRTIPREHLIDTLWGENRLGRP